MKKFLPLLIVLAVCAGCRRDMPEPANWNPEKALGLRNRAAPQIAWAVEIVTNSLDHAVTTNMVSVATAEPPPQPFTLPSLAVATPDPALVVEVTTGKSAPVRGATVNRRTLLAQRNIRPVQPQTLPVPTQGFRRVSKPLLIDDEEP